MSRITLRRFVAFVGGILLLALALFFPFHTQNGGGRYALTAQAARAYDPSIAVLKYDVDMTLQTDRKVLVEEQITVQFIKSGKRMFYRSLPKDGAIYSDITAKCEGNTAFYYEVADNPDYDEFIDINCMGGTAYGNIWTYELSYIMHQNTGDTGDAMLIDVVGFGWPVQLNDVTVTFHFPASITQDAYRLYVGYHSDTPDQSEVERTLSEDGKTLTLHADLDVQYIAEYEEYMAQGITLDFTLPEGTMQSYLTTRVFTAHFWTVAGLCVVAIVGTLAGFFLCRKKKEIISVVNVKAPDDMDPMKMGKWLDGVVDNEDITSMIYYFAQKGYLIVNLEDENDPILIKQVDVLPDSEPMHAKTLFKGLFRSGRSVSSTDLAEKFYKDAQMAQLQLPSPKMFDKKSVFGFIGGGLIAFLLAFLVPIVLSANVGGGYVCLDGVFFIIPVALILGLAYVRESYRYKWKTAAKMGVLLAEVAVAVIATLIFQLTIAKHIVTREEVFLLCLGMYACVFLATNVLSRQEEYVTELGEILGFKDFILYTEEDKIKVMLEQNPELYYKVLPYAQVLGVTKEWEGKFAHILMEPPYWCVGSHMTVFDYMIMHRCMTRAMQTAMRPPQESSTGRSGGGGSFGSFGGGGFGGGGGGAR